MKVETPWTKAAGAAASWRYTYGRTDGTWYDPGKYGDREEIYDKLIALGPTPEPGFVDQIIGSTSWTRCVCTECEDKNARAVVQLGQEPDYESCTAWVCLECLTLASDAIKIQLEKECGK